MHIVEGTVAWSNPDQSAIDVIINHPVFGEIPFTVLPIGDTADVFEKLKSGKVLDYVPPSVEFGVPNLDQAQFLWFLARYGYGDIIHKVIESIKGDDIDLSARLSVLCLSPGVVSFDNFMGYLTHQKIMPLLPDGFDASEKTLAQHWQAALKS